MLFCWTTYGFQLNLRWDARLSLVEINHAALGAMWKIAV
jgi:hypothetical protein